MLIIDFILKQEQIVKMYFLTLLGVTLLSVTYGEYVTVSTALGSLTGIKEDTNFTGNLIKVNKFYGIPFAKPPLGELRFKKPVPLEKFPGDATYNATYFRPYCPHILYEFPTPGEENEDCLYLNIYVPELKPDMTSGHAVMIFIYGGSFLMGGSNGYDGTNLAAHGNVIVVTFNYRLGIFGFLSTMDEVAPGNYGLFDQALVIQWVHDNIASFGGDPGRVTVFGESAGAMSANIQGLYTGNHGKIHRILAESGAANSPFMHFSQDKLTPARAFAETVGCTDSDSASLIKCLRAVPWENFLNEKSGYMFNEMLTLSPRVDGDIIKIDAAHLSEKLRYQTLEEVDYFRSLDFLSGLNAYEGATMLSLFTGVLDLEQLRPTKDEVLSTLIPTTTKFTHGKILSNVTNLAILHDYTDWTDPNSQDLVRVQFTKLAGDVIFDAPAVEMARIHSSKVDDNMGTGNTYMYHFLPRVSKGILKTPSWLNGANHGDELQFVFGLTTALTEDWEMALSQKIITYWSNFAKTGNPNKPVPTEGMWPLYNSSEHYLAFDNNLDQAFSRQYLGVKSAHFWNDVIPALTNQKTSSNCTVKVSGAMREKVVPEILLGLTSLSIVLVNIVLGRI